MTRNANARATDPGAAASALRQEIVADYHTSSRQVYDSDGQRLPARRWAIEGAPRGAVPGWHRWAAAERWRAVAP